MWLRPVFSFQCCRMRRHTCLLLDCPHAPPPPHLLPQLLRAALLHAAWHASGLVCCCARPRPWTNGWWRVSGAAVALACRPSVATGCLLCAGAVSQPVACCMRALNSSQLHMSAPAPCSDAASLQSGSVDMPGPSALLPHHLQACRAGLKSSSFGGTWAATSWRISEPWLAGCRPLLAATLAAVLRACNPACWVSCPGALRWGMQL